MSSLEAAPCSKSRNLGQYIIKLMFRPDIIDPFMGLGSIVFPPTFWPLVEGFHTRFELTNGFYIDFNPRDGLQMPGVENLD